MRLLITLAVLATICDGATDRDGLGRTFATLRNDASLTIGYFGGSITAGSGASKPEQTSYRALTTRWFRDQFPDARITEVNAAIGGTGSELGVFRCNSDLLSRKPDLVFVEFAVNDGGTKETRVLRSMEGIVRQVWRANPAAEIVFLYTIHRMAMADNYDKGEFPLTVQWHERLAEAYRIPSLNIGRAIWQTVHDGKATWTDLLPDNVHPSDAGMTIYAKQIAAFLDAHRKDKPQEPGRKFDTRLTDESFENAHVVETSEVAAEGWSRDDAAAAKFFPRHIAASAPGTVLTYRFQGTALGLYWIIAPDSGDIEWSVDGSAPARASLWDKYALRFSRKHYRLLVDSLPQGEHELKVRILPDKNPESTGTWIRIGGLLVN